MNPFPHFPNLPPATPAQAAQVYALLHVTPKIVRYDRLTSALAIAADALGLLLIWLFLATKLSARLRDIAERIAPKSLFLQTAITYVLISICLAVVGLPFSFYRGWIVQKQFGLSNQSVLQWLLDHLKAVGIDMLVIGLIAGLLLTIVRKSPNRWPYWCAAVMAPIAAFGIFLEPLLFEPMFNHFTLLSASQPLYSELEGLAHKAGVGTVPIYIVDKSKQTNETNAYVTGFGPSLRIVLWDTTLRKMDNQEIVAITGHEMGHYVEGHLVIGFALSVLELFIVFPLIRFGALRWLARSGERWHLRGVLHDPAALPLLLLCLQITFLIATPIANQVSRWIEHRADAYSLGLVRDRVGLARGFVALSEQDLEDPYPPTWEKLWFDDHPPSGERIKFALYGQPNQ